MKLKRIGLLLILPVVVLTLPGSATANGSNFGHVSFVEEQAVILRSDGAEQKAVVNLPLVPGDTVVTGDSGRCELQFDNGTVIRLDKNTRLQLTTLQAPSLTSRWSVTTLNLPRGQVYTLPQTYNREMFQIITPNAAVKLENRTAATIRFDADLGTALFSDAGSFEVLYGDNGKAPEKIKVKSGQAFVITTAHVLAGSSEKRNLEFVAWNEYVDRHFKELHYGISKVPPKLKFGNSALQYWAEKWSSRFG
ncbi:MAG TPA: FecR family protein, partial [Candidatus Binatia bacterium]|nr:FecR family protein [Candidatus Binatia bacterium]